jgi:DNA-binding NarL/FixJ family response regulator
LAENKFVYSTSSKNKILGDIPHKYLNKGYQYLKKICHPLDFADLIKEIVNLVYSAENEKNMITKSMNGGHVLRAKNKNGEWQKRKVHLIYIKECNSKLSKVLFGFIDKDAAYPNKETNGITSREKQIFQFLSTGYSSKMIADKLCIGETTVITHRKNMIQKLKVKNTAELIKKGYEMDILNLISNSNLSLTIPINED